MASPPKPATTRTSNRAADYGRKLFDEPENPEIDEYFLRRKVLRETLRCFETLSPGHYHELARQNLRHWKQEAAASNTATSPKQRCCEVRVVAGDWGEVALRFTAKHGTTFAVLNMANAYVPGGGYAEGCPAQEENMFRRTDCHFSLELGTAMVRREFYDFGGDEYLPNLTRLIGTSPEGLVFLDTMNPRVCIRGPEDRSRDDLGYGFLPNDQVFPFYELRAAAMDLRGRRRFCPDETRRRIAGQLDTLVAARVRHAVLSAFGCGAFGNPAEGVAAIYKQEIEKRQDRFDVVVFAIFYPGYGPDNLGAFEEAFRGFGSSERCRGGGSEPKKARTEPSGYTTPSE